MPNKAAVYCGTRNLYYEMTTAAKSLAKNSSVDEIYFLIEDPEFPFALPEYVHCIDVSKQQYFGKKCPNVYKLWTWMVLMRAALPKIFPRHNQILSLDVDTIVTRNIDDLWNLDLDGYYLAGVPEPKKSKPGMPYVNMGAVIFNLDLLRTTKMDDRIIKILNNNRFQFAEQDCINELCGEQILELPSIYNANNYTRICDDPAILHFANEKNWRDRPIVQKYRDIQWPKKSDRKKPTNGDRYRAMTDDQLAHYLCNHACSCCPVSAATGCPGRMDIGKVKCQNNWLRWLKEESKI